MRNIRHRLGNLNNCTQLVALFDKVSQGFENVRPLPTSSLFSLLNACSSRSEPLASALVAMTIACLPTIKDFYKLSSISCHGHSLIVIHMKSDLDGRKSLLNNLPSEHQILLKYYKTSEMRFNIYLIG